MSNHLALFRFWVTEVIPHMDLFREIWTWENPKLANQMSGRAISRLVDFVAKWRHPGYSFVCPGLNWVKGDTPL